MGEKVTSLFERAIDVLGRIDHVSNVRFWSNLKVSEHLVIFCIFFIKFVNTFLYERGRDEGRGIVMEIKYLDNLCSGIVQKYDSDTGFDEIFNLQ